MDDDIGRDHLVDLSVLDRPDDQPADPLGQPVELDLHVLEA